MPGGLVLVFSWLFFGHSCLTLVVGLLYSAVFDMFPKALRLLCLAANSASILSVIRVVDCFGGSHLVVATRAPHDPPATSVLITFDIASHAHNSQPSDLLPC